jgi:hypothetical protein
MRNDTMMNGNDALFKMREGIEPRWFSFENRQGLKGAATRGNDGRKRSAWAPLKKGESLTLAEINGRSGVVRKLWFAFSGGPTPGPACRPELLRGVRVDFFWDGAKTPAVSAPFGDLFCMGLGKLYAFENALFANPEGRNIVCHVPMPFKKGMKLVVTNESPEDIAWFFYKVNCTVGDPVGDDDLYFHAYWKRENPTTEEHDYEFLPKVAGRGRYLGVNFGVCVDKDKLYEKTWWGEGEVKVYLDGDHAYPTLCGTGTEDYIGTSWGQGKFCLPYSGCPYADGEKMEYAFYRFHLPDPVYFRQDIRATIQQIGNGGPEPLAKMRQAGIQLRLGKEIIEHVPDTGCCFERHDDWSSCVYFYLDKPENGLPPLAPVSARL